MILRSLIWRIPIRGVVDCVVNMCCTAVRIKKTINKGLNMQHRVLGMDGKLGIISIKAGKIINGLQGILGGGSWDCSLDGSWVSSRRSSIGADSRNWTRIRTPRQDKRRTPGWPARCSKNYICQRCIIHQRYIRWIH